MTKREFWAIVEEYGWDYVFANVHRDSIDDPELAEYFFIAKQSIKDLEDLSPVSMDDEDELYVHDVVDAFNAKSTLSEMDNED